MEKRLSPATDALANLLAETRRRGQRRLTVRLEPGYYPLSDTLILHPGDWDQLILRGPEEGGCVIGAGRPINGWIPSTRNGVEVWASALPVDTRFGRVELLAD